MLAFLCMAGLPQVAVAQTSVAAAPAAQSCAAHTDPYFTSLIIRDQRQIQRLDPRGAGPRTSSHFRTFLSSLTSAGNVDTYVDNWAKLWEAKVTLNGDDSLARPGTARAFRAAWSSNRIDLIAVVNRMDLAKFDADGNVTALGEGRYVYELRGDDFQRRETVLPFTIILEFDLPVLDPTLDLNRNLELWACKWMSLSHLSGQDYDARLDEITALFGTADQLARIRTNEQMNTPDTSWELRQFGVEEKSGELAQQVLPQTPRQPLKAADNPTLTDYVASYEQDIIAGKHAFDDAEWLTYLGAKSIPDRAPLWRRTPYPNYDPEAFLIMAALTCDGCHKEILSPSVFTHLSRVNLGANAGAAPHQAEAMLSPFLKDDTRTDDFDFPNCGNNGVPQPWCLQSNTWNERTMRITLLNCYLDLATCFRVNKSTESTAPDRILSPIPPPYRYH